MEKMNISEDRVLGFVKEGLLLIGYPNNIEVKSYVGDNDKPCYYAEYYKDYKGIMTKHMKPLRVKDFTDLMQFAMEVNGYDISNIDIRIRDNRICYSVFTDIASTGYGKKKRRK